MHLSLRHQFIMASPPVHINLASPDTPQKKKSCKARRGKLAKEEALNLDRLHQSRMAFWEAYLQITCNRGVKRTLELVTDCYDSLEPERKKQRTE